MKSQLIHIDFTSASVSMFEAYTALPLDAIRHQVTLDVELGRAVLYTYDRWNSNWPDYQMVFTWSSIPQVPRACDYQPTAEERWAIQCVKKYEELLPGINIRIQHETDATRCWFSRSGNGAIEIKDLEWLPNLSVP